MFGLISAGVSLAGLGMNALQAIKANKDMKKYAAEADKNINQYAQGRMTNYMAGLQTPDVSSLAYQQNQRAMSQGADVISQGGAESAIGGAANLVQSAQEANLQAAQQQAVMNQATQQKILGTEQDIEEEAFGRGKEAQAWKAGNAMAQQNQAAETKASAISGIASGLSAGLGSLSTMFDPATGKYLGGRNSVSAGNVNSTLDAQNAGMTQQQIGIVSNPYLLKALGR